jgi:hypothetical protein
VSQADTEPTLEEPVVEIGDVVEQVVEDALPVGTVEMILSADDIEEKWVDVPEWKCKVLLRGFTKALQRDVRRNSEVGGDVDNDRMQMLTLIHGVAEPELTEEMYGQLMQKSAIVVDRLILEILTLAGLDAKAISEAEASFREGSGSDAAVHAG